MGLKSRYRFRLPVQEAVEHDLGSIAKFQPPDGRLLLAFEDDGAVGTASWPALGTGDDLSLPGSVDMLA